MENIGAGFGDGCAGKVKTSVWGKRLVNLHVGRGQHSEREAAVDVEVLMADDVDVVVAGRYFGSAYADEPGITDAVVEGRNGDGRGIADVADCLVGTEVEDYLYG